MILETVGSIFGAVAQQRAAKAAAGLLAQARATAIAQGKEINAQFDPFVTAASERLGTSFDTTARLIGMAEAGAQEGLTPADRLSMEDAQRLLNENLVATGNLRSGAAAFQGAELGRRVLADASQRRLQYLNLAFGGAQGLGNIAGTTGQLGLGGKQLATNLFTAAMGLAPAQGSAELQYGAARAAQYQAMGRFGDEAISMMVGAGMGGGMGMGAGAGAMLGSGYGGSLGNLMMMQSVFGGGAPRGGPMGGGAF